MKNLKSTFLLLTLLLATSCGEETLTKSQQKTSITATDISTFEVTNKSLSRLEKPPVDILYIVDNSGSTLIDSFQSLKGQIQNTLYNVSNEFDYHIYFTPLIPASGDSITSYPLIASDPSSLNGAAGLNIVSVENLSPFTAASGNNVELGFQRALTIIENNISNNIFRQNANTIVVMISNGDDTSAKKTIYGNQVNDPDKLNEIEGEFRRLTKQYGTSSPLKAESLRFISLVAHQNCSFATIGTNYQLMSQRLYDYQGFTDNNNSKDSFDLCSRDYSGLFSAVNSSIRQVLVGHKYDHWLISSQSESSIAVDDITLTKVNGNTGAKSNIARSSTNGFEYLGPRTNQDTRYFPDAGEPVSGLVVKLNGAARVDFPDYITSKTRTPTEYFGYIPLPRDPDLTTVEVIINGTKYGQSGTNGWTYFGYREILNIKVPGTTGASVNPPLNKSGYFLRLHGSAIYSSGDNLQIFYKAKAI